MSDQIAIQAHSLPWEPAANAKLVEVYDRYDVPLIGRVRQCGVDYLFWCVDGAFADKSVWAYALVSAQDIEKLESAEDFDAAFGEVTANRPAVLAHYHEGEGILLSYPVEHPSSYDSLLEAARAQNQAVMRELADV